MVGEDTVPSEAMMVGDNTQYDLADDDPAEVDLAEDKLVADEDVNDCADGKTIERGDAEPPKFEIFPSRMISPSRMKKPPFSLQRDCAIVPFPQQ